MAKGILYVMTTIVPGLIKIGKTTAESFDSRMYNLERNGYSNVVGLKRYFAIEVEDYAEKEILLGDIFSKSRIPNTELFALDIDLVVQLLTSFEGNQLYPRNTTKEKVFQDATKERSIKENIEKIPDGVYHLRETLKKFGEVKATMRVEEGAFIVEKGSICAPARDGWNPKARREAIIENNVLQEDVQCNSPSTAAWVVFGNAKNGWDVWQDSDENLISIYRKMAE